MVEENGEKTRQLRAVSGSGGITQGGLIKDRVVDMFASMTLRERRVGILRFALDGGRVVTQKEVGQVIGRSPRTVRRLEKSFLAKLVDPYNL